MTPSPYQNQEQSQSVALNLNQLESGVEIVESKPKTFFQKFVIGLSFAVLALLAVFAVSVNTKTFAPAAVKNDMSLYSTAATIYINVTLSDYDSPSSLSYLPWDFLMEPHKSNTIAVTSMLIDGEEVDYEDATVTWTINDKTHSGVSATVSLSDTGVFDSYVVVEYNSKSYIRYFTIANKYIRREIRSLTTADREAFFSALMTLYNVNTTYGQELYGSKYVSMETLLYYHLNGAGRTDCDHWHDGAAIVTHHSAYTLQAEQSLQSVNPTLAMPYWEYPLVSYNSRI